jgi:DNA-binding transcriptional regulator YiaG
MAKKAKKVVDLTPGPVTELEPELELELDVTVGRIDALKSFGATLSQSMVQERAKELLPRILRKADSLRLKRVKIADRCHVSVATVSRWANGIVVPHILMAKAAIGVVRDLAVEKALEYQMELKRQNEPGAPN